MNINNNGYNPNYQTQINTDYLKSQYPDWSDPTQVRMTPDDTLMAQQPYVQQQQDNREQPYALQQDNRIPSGKETASFDFDKMKEEFLEFKKLIIKESDDNRNNNNHNNHNNHVNYQVSPYINTQKTTEIPVNLVVTLILNIKINQV